eukprot:4954825-Lingulodinium_polyedra.AAC.1
MPAASASSRPRPRVRRAVTGRAMRARRPGRRRQPARRGSSASSTPPCVRSFRTGSVQPRPPSVRMAAGRPPRQFAGPAGCS